MGIGLLGIGLGLGAVLVAAAVGPLWAWALLPLYYQGTRFILDHYTGTCPLKAELGEANLEARYLSVRGKPVEDPALVAAIRATSRHALLQTLSVSLTLTLVTMSLLVIAG
jgi:hypothetical protein